MRIVLTMGLLVGCAAGGGLETGTTDGLVTGETGQNSNATSQTSDPYGVVAIHNQIRAGVEPAPEVPLPPMTWDEGLAQIAQEWADGCDFEHSTNAYGENLFVSTYSADGPDAVYSWAEEAADYDYDTNQCRSMCGHYTQIVWRDSIHVGCAYADCSTLTGAGFSSGRLWVCNYDPAGNWVGERPY